MPETELKPEVLQAIRASEAFLPDIGKGTGYRPDPLDTRDFRARATLAALPAPPPRASLREHVPPRRDQGLQGSCTGFAITGAVETIRRRDSHFETRYSPQAAYNWARMAIGELNRDEGAYIRSTAQDAQRIGVCRESDFPYYEIEDKMFVPPPPDAYESARSFRIGPYRRCESLDDVRRAIANGFPVVLGFLCYSNLYQARDTGRVPLPSGSVQGGHAVFGAEYDDASRYVSCPNSWGKRWGDAGWLHIPYAFWERGAVSDAWAIEAEAAETQFPHRGAPVTA